MVEVNKVAEEILAFLHEEFEKHGRLSTPITALYKYFEKQASYDVIQQALKFLTDRDLIAPSSYGLTAKGRREHTLKRAS